MWGNLPGKGEEKKARMNFDRHNKKNIRKKTYAAAESAAAAAKLATAAEFCRASAAFDVLDA